MEVKCATISTIKLVLHNVPFYSSYFKYELLYRALFKCVIAFKLV